MMFFAQIQFQTVGGRGVRGEFRPPVSSIPSRVEPFRLNFFRKFKDFLRFHFQKTSELRLTNSILVHYPLQKLLSGGIFQKKQSSYSPSYQQESAIRGGNSNSLFCCLKHGPFQFFLPGILFP